MKCCAGSQPGKDAIIRTRFLEIVMNRAASLMAYRRSFAVSRQDGFRLYVCEMNVDSQTISQCNDDFLSPLAGRTARGIAISIPSCDPVLGKPLVRLVGPEVRYKPPLDRVSNLRKCACFFH